MSIASQQSAQPSPFTGPDGDRGRFGSAALACLSVIPVLVSMSAARVLATPIAGVSRAFGRAEARLAYTGFRRIWGFVDPPWGFLVCLGTSAR